MSYADLIATTVLLSAFETCSYHPQKQMEESGIEPAERGLPHDPTAQHLPVKPPSGNPQRISNGQPTRPQHENKCASESEDDSDPSMSPSEELEMDDLVSDAGSEADEETGLTGKESRKHLQKQRQSVPLDVRIAGDTAISEEAKKVADQHVLNDLFLNAVLIGLWYSFSLSISIVSVSPGQGVRISANGHTAV